MTDKNYIGKLSEMTVENHWKPPVYEEPVSTGPDNCKWFTVRVCVEDQHFSGAGTSKKEARHDAAKKALEHLRLKGAEASAGSAEDENFNHPSVQQKHEPSSSDSDKIVEMCVVSNNQSLMPRKTDYISLLMTECQRTGRHCQFLEVQRRGPSHEPLFSYKVVIDGKEYDVGSGKNKKEAKSNAAELAWSVLTGSDGDTSDSIIFTDSSNSSKAQAADENFNHPSVQQKDEPSLSDSDKIVEMCVVSNNQSLMPRKTDYISLLMTECQRTGRHCQFLEVQRQGPSHEPLFFHKAVIDGKHYDVGTGKNKKEAKSNAAELAWSALTGSEGGSKGSVGSTVSDDSSTGFSSSAQESQESSSQRSTSDSIIFTDSSNPSRAQDAGHGKNVGNDSTQSEFRSKFDSMELLGSGSFGGVFKARQKRLDRCYAVKIIRWEENALREVVALSDLSHPNIIRYYTFWEELTGYKWHVNNPEEKFLYIQMELCDTTLRQWIDGWLSDARDNSKRRAEGLNVAQQILSGVEHIHSQNCIHRDLKPANILFRDRVVKIGDFGLVTSDDNAGMDRTECHGTPSYMAPEQQNKRTYNRKVDIFALGLIFFEILWKMSGHERVKIWNNVRGHMFPSEFTCSFHKESVLIEGMLQQNPEDRPEAASIKADVDQWIQLFSSDDSLQENQTI